MPKLVGSASVGSGAGGTPTALKPYWRSDCGNYEVWLGDCLDVMSFIEHNSIDMIWTDPPYGHGNMDGDLQEARVRDGVKGARTKAAESITNDYGTSFEHTMLGFLDRASVVLNRDCCCCCCCMAGGGPTPTFAKVSQWIDARLAFFQAVVWDKSLRGNGMGWRYRRNYEFVMVAHRKGGTLLWANDSAVPNIVRHMPVANRQHPNEKPVEMVVDFIRWHTSNGMIILDPFMGSGTTGVACVIIGRRFIGIEVDEAYCKIAVGRIQRAMMDQGLMHKPSMEDAAEAVPFTRG